MIDWLFIPLIKDTICFSINVCQYRIEDYITTPLSIILLIGLGVFAAWIMKDDINRIQNKPEVSHE